MEITVRPYKSKDAESFAEIHFAAVHITAANYYTKDILDEWSPAVSQKRIEHINKYENKETRIIAEYNNEIAGLGVVVPEKNLLGACYVHPNFSRKGIGRTIMDELEKIALSKETTYLEMDASINTKDFYEHCGYEIIEKTFHELKNGMKMDCYKMKKQLKKKSS